MGAQLLSMIVTAAMTTTMIAVIAYFAFDRVIKKKVEAHIAASADSIATLIKTRVTEGVTEAVENHREELGAEIEEKVRDGARQGIQDGVAGLRSSFIEKAGEQASKSSIELVGDAIDMWLKYPNRWRRR